MITLHIKRGKEASILRQHPWIFSGAIARQSGKPKDGEVVTVLDAQDNVLGVGHYTDGSIMVRLLAHENVTIDQAFYQDRLQVALNFRKTLSIPSSTTHCYRLVHGEGDRLPGLVIDVYGDTAIVQCHSIGMFKHMKLISAALQSIFGDSLKAIYNKSAESLPKNYASGTQNGYVFGESQAKVVLENGIPFFVDWEQGQKTGFFLDQRNNRFILGQYAYGKTVLNTFCYSGGFSLYALMNGAKEVVSVDVSAKAMEWTDRNVEINLAQKNHTSLTEDVMHYIKTEERTFDIVVVDPPAFAKSVAKRHQAVQGYKRLNAHAMQRVEKGGLLFTFSCSQVVDETLFYNTIVAAALEVGRPVRVLHRLSQPPDHPVNMFHPEGHYLKGLVLEIG